MDLDAVVNRSCGFLRLLFQHPHPDVCDRLYHGAVGDVAAQSQSRQEPERLVPEVRRHSLRVWTDETGELDVEVTLAHGGVEVRVAAVLPAPHSLERWPSFERNDRGTEFQVRGLETVSMPRRNGRSPDSLKDPGYSSRCKCTWCSLTDSHPMIRNYTKS